MRQRTKRKDNGSALVIAIVAIFLMSLLAMSSLLVSTAGSHLTGHRRDTQQAFDIAEAGFEHAYRSLADNGTYTAQSNVPFGTGWFTTAVNAGPSAGTQEIISRGIVLGGEGIYSSRTIEGLIQVGSMNQLLGYSVVSKGDVSMNGSVKIDSLPATGEGDVSSNGNVSLNGSVSIQGTLAAGGTVSTTGKAGATGGTTQGASPITFPTVNASGFEAEAAVNGTTNGNVSAGTGTVLQGVINGNVSASGGGSFRVNGVVYITGDLTLTGNSYMGDGTLVVLGSVKITGSSGLSTPDTSKLAIIDLSTSSSAVSLSGGASVGGFIYCPNGGVSLTGGANVFGGIATDSISFSGSSSVTRNTAQQPPTGLNGATIEYWNDESGT